LLVMYLGVILIGVFRAVYDRSYIEGYPLKNLISEELVNTIKWVLPGILLFDGCRTRRRVVMALISLLTMYFLIAAQVIRRLPFSSVLAGGGTINETRKACEDIGYGAVDMSTFLAGACWGIIASQVLVRQRKYKALILAAAGMVAFGQAMTGGRAGYLAWGTIGLLLCLIKWRKYLILVPVILILIPIVLPGAVDRMLEGFGDTDVAGQSMIDDSSVTSGRTLVWPHVVNKIGESPMVGYGRLAMRRTGLAEQFKTERFPHPHNMYLETLLDNGILGSIPILSFWILLVVYSGRLFVSDNRLCSAVGGAAFSLTVAQLVAGIGSQHFYPEESTLGAWVVMFLAVRVYLERSRSRTDAKVVEGSWSSQALTRQAAIPAFTAQEISIG